MKFIRFCGIFIMYTIIIFCEQEEGQIMDKLTYFKNFNMGRELEICGDFLYESMRAMYSFRSFHEHFTINKILYFGSVGIERLQKIILCLYNFNTEESFDSAPKYMHEHNHSTLHDQIKKSVSDLIIKKELLCTFQLFQEYYNNHRYGEFELNYSSDQLVSLFANYLSNITGKKFDAKEPINPCDFELMKKLYINHLGKIATEYFKIIKNKSNELNIYTTELYSDSNAYKVFYCLEEKMYENIRFESIAFKELIVYLSKIGSKANIKKISRSLKKIHFDPAMINDYLTELSVFKSSSMLTDEVYEFYNQLETEKKRKDRKELVDLIGNPFVVLD